MYEFLDELKDILEVMFDGNIETSDESIECYGFEGEYPMRVLFEKKEFGLFMEVVFVGYTDKDMDILRQHYIGSVLLEGNKLVNRTDLRLDFGRQFSDNFWLVVFRLNELIFHCDDASSFLYDDRFKKLSTTH